MSVLPAIGASGFPGNRVEAHRAGIMITALMDAAHSSAAISRRDAELMRRFTIALLFILLFTAAFSQLYRLYAKKTYDITGPAQWIWAQHRVSRNVPVVFFAVRDFDLPANRVFTKLKILGDPEYTLYVNGRELASRRVAEDQRHLDRYDISAFVKNGRNRLTIAVRSTDGVGGLIAAIDLGPEIENAIVTDSQWKIFRTWRDDLPFRDSPSERAQRPMILGQPPTGRWNYLDVREAAFEPPITRVVRPKSAMNFDAEIPVVEIRNGVAVAGTQRVPATAYDFGPTAGRVRLMLSPDVKVQAELTRRDRRDGVIRVRLANAREELSAVESQIFSVPFGPGERMLIDPQVQHFRYVVVLGRQATADVVQ